MIKYKTLLWKVIDKLKDAKYFNKLNLIWGYNNIWIKEENKWKVAFLTNKGLLFESKVIYFRLCNSPGTFQRIMNSIFKELLHKEVLTNYMDNFVILAKTKKELEERMICFLKIAEKHNLYFKQSKCDFNVEKIHILGVVVRWEEVQIENNKIKIVKEWRISTKIKEVESFLGFINIYRQFIKNFSYIVRLLNELKGEKEWKWEGEHQKTFEELKDKIISQLVLALPKRDGKFKIKMDALGYTVRGVLF